MFVLVQEKKIIWPLPTNGSDALMQNGMIERSIANAIMGLEGLLLKSGGEVQELAHRLSNRTAKLLSNFKYDPLEVKKIVSDAYGARSLFVHGGQTEL